MLPSNFEYTDKNGGVKSNGSSKSNSSGGSFIIVIVVIFLFLILFFGYRFFTYSKLRKAINCGDCGYFFTERGGKDGMLPRKIEARYLNPPTENESSTWCFWMRIDDWYHRYGLWKNIMVKGTEVEVEDDFRWNVLKKQCPGVWLTPSQNNIRCVFNTKIYKNFNYDNYLEYCQINDIPIGEWVFVALVLIDQTVAIYINGELERTCVFDGKPEYNNGPLHVNYSGGFNGKFGALRYISTSLQPQEIKQLYNMGSPDKYKNYFMFKFPSFQNILDYFRGTTC